MAWGDFFSTSWDDPKTMMMMQAAAGLLAGNPVGQNRATLGQSLSRGLLGGMQGYQQGLQAKRQGEQLELQKREADLREQQLQAELDAKRQEQMRAQQQREAQDKFWGLLSGQGMSPQQALTTGAQRGSLGPTPANAALMNQPWNGQITPQLAALWAQGGGKIDDLEKLSGMRNFGRPEVSNFFDQRNPDGTVTRAGTTKFGDVVNTGAVPFKDQSIVDFGGHLYLRDPVTNKLQPMGKKTMTPGEEASNQVAWANNAVSRGQLGVAQGNLALSRDRLAFDRSQPTLQILNTPQGPVAVDQRTAAAHRVTLDGQPIPGEAQIKRQRDAATALSLFEEAEKILPQATGSRVGATADNLAGWVGRSTPGGEAGARLQVIQGALIANAPRMEGPQSDRDAQLYREAVGQIGDATIPVARRMAAIQTAKAIQQKYATGPTGTAGGGQANDPLGILPGGGANDPLGILR